MSLESGSDFLTVKIFSGLYRQKGKSVRSTLITLGRHIPLYNSLGSVLGLKQNIKLPQMSEFDRFRMRPLRTPLGLLIIKALLVPPTRAFQSLSPCHRHFFQ